MEDAFSNLLTMRKLAFSFLLAATAALAQYKLESAGAAPSELAPEVTALLQKDGHRIVAPNGSVFCEVWLRTALPSGPKTTEEGVSLATTPHGALMGAIRFPKNGTDRRGLGVKPGVYTLRFSIHPVDGSHQGVAPQRDFLILSLAAEDRDPNATPAFEKLMEMSRKASGIAHPLALSIGTASGEKFPEFAKESEGDWVLKAQIGDLKIFVILVGVFQG